VTSEADPQVSILHGTKQQIVDAARRLFSDHSYLGVSMSEIASRLGITKAALYYHFSGKREIYQSVLEEALSDLRGLLDTDDGETSPGDRLSHMVRRYLEFGIREKNLVNALVMQLSPRDSSLREFVCSAREEILDPFISVIDEVLASGRPSAPLDSKLMATMLTAMMDGFILKNSFLDSSLDPDLVSREIVAILGLGTA